MTLLSILADLKISVVWVVSTRPLISKSSSPCMNSLVTVPRAPSTIAITVTFILHSFFNSQVRSKYLSFFLLSFNFTLWSTGTVKSAILQILFIYLLIFFFDYYKGGSSGWDQVIRLYVKISETFVSLILQDRYTTVHIPFVRMIKFQFLA